MTSTSELSPLYPPNQCIQQFVEYYAAHTPHEVAVIFENRSLTYVQLNQRANQLAHYLQKQGVGPEVLVGICTQRSLDLIVGLLAILKAGGAYVPMDPVYPEDRLKFIMEDAGAPVVLTEQSLKDMFISGQAQVLCLDTDWATHIAAEADTNPISGTTADNLAYVIYTSGSTGKPKGVLVTHYNVVRLFEATQAWFHFDNHDVWSLFHSYAFDFSVWEIWGALMYGGKLVVVSYTDSRSPQAFCQLLSREQVTVLNQTPSAFRQLIQADHELALDPASFALRVVIFGGEALDLQSLKPWYERHGDQKPQLVNMYGITETTVHVTYRSLTWADVTTAQGSLIGGPIPDLQLYIVDENLQLCPVGQAGEMLVGGAGVARGYLNRPELTAQRFIPDTFNPTSTGKLYRSGDLARALPNGDIEYLGRIDFQVKIRGFRIELGEIESVLKQYPTVRNAVVLAREDVPGDKRLVAYLVLQTLPAPSVTAWWDFLQKKLPDYMIPSAFMVMEELPLTPNGKIDRKALPAPTVDIARTVVAPRTPLEEKLVTIWQELFGLEQISVDDKFLALGGHSILATRLITRYREQLQLDLPIIAIFERATIAEQAEYIETMVGESLGSSDEREEFEL